MTSESNRVNRRDKKHHKVKYGPKKLGLPQGLPKTERVRREVVKSATSYQVDEK